MVKMRNPGKSQLRIGQISSTVLETNPQYLSLCNICKNKIGLLKHQISKTNNNSKSWIKIKKLKTNKL